MFKSDRGRCPEHLTLLDVYKELCEIVQINGLFPSLISLRVIDINDKDEICQGGTNIKMVGALLEKFIYPELTAGETTRFNFFLAALRRAGKYDFLVEKTETLITHYRSPRDSPSSDVTYVQSLEQSDEASTKAKVYLKGTGSSTKEDSQCSNRRWIILVVVTSVLYLCVNTKFDLSSKTGSLSLKLEIGRLTLSLTNFMDGDVSSEAWSQVLAESSDKSSGGDQVIPVIVKISSALNSGRLTSDSFLAYKGGCEMFLYLHTNAPNCEDINVGLRFHATTCDCIKSSQFTVKLLNQSYHHQIIQSTIGLSCNELHQSKYLSNNNTLYFKVSHNLKHTIGVFFYYGVYITVMGYMSNVYSVFFLLVLVELIWSLYISINNLIKELWTGNMFIVFRTYQTLDILFSGYCGLQ